MKLLTTVMLTGVVMAVVLLIGDAEEGMPTPPLRPSLFRSPNDLRDYLQKLNEYYAIVGRPRFGKRNNDYFTDNYNDWYYDRV